MMMMGDGIHLNPTVHAPPWSMFDDPTEGMSYSLPVSGVTRSIGEAAIATLQRYLPSDDPYAAADAVSDESDPADAYFCDEFRMYQFKVRLCARGRSHDWTDCPYAHSGEKARRRDPRKYHYSGAACPEFRKGGCKRGDSCEFAHGVFECWLHPARYRTQPCKDGVACRRRVCFFAHTPDQLRALLQQFHQIPRGSPSPESYDGSPLRCRSLDVDFPKNLMSSSPSSPSDFPSMDEVLASLRQLQLISKGNTVPSSWGCQLGSSVFGSPRGSGGVRAGFSSTAAAAAFETVEFGRALRAKMFERLSIESGLEKSETAGPAPDVDWVSDLVK